MDFQLTVGEEAFRREVRDFFRHEAPEEWTRQLVKEQNAVDAHSPEPYMKIAKKGWLGLTMSKEYGGQELSAIYEALLAQEMAYCMIPYGTANVYFNSAQLLAHVLHLSGTEEQKRRLLPLIKSGELRTSNGITEPEAGCDAAACQTKAVEDGDFFILNGTKIFNNAVNANHITVVCRTDPKVSKHRGISLLLIDLASPGVSVSRSYRTIAGWARCEVNFDNVRVPKANLLGEKNRGWYYLVGPYLATERANNAANQLGEMERLFDKLLDYARETRRDGEVLERTPAFRHMLAEMRTELVASRLLVYRCFPLIIKGIDASVEAGMAKLITSEGADRLTNIAMEILGQSSELEHDGAPLNGLVPQLYCDNQRLQVAGGSSEIMRNVIALRGLNLPRG